jgi:hypothetical protein
VIVDRALIILPEDRELMFACLGVLQKWINNYDARMKSNDVSGGRVVFRLNYKLRTSALNWRLLECLKLRLAHLPVEYTEAPDVVFDFSDARMLAFASTGKHASQIAGMMLGEDAEPYLDEQGVKRFANFPDIKKVQISTFDKWLNVPIEEEDFIQSCYSEEYTGVIGAASWQTYAAAAMGLAVIEIVPAQRPKNWLTKWASSLYRVVEAGNQEGKQIDSAKKSIVAYLQQQREAVDHV